MHVILLGDSIFDNKVYIGKQEPDVRAQVAALRPQSDTVTLLAIDGNVIADVPNQLKRLPDDATHLVLSVGGNDLLMELMALNSTANSVYEVFGRLATISMRFLQAYSAMLTQVVAHDLPLTICTMYNPRFADEAQQVLSVTALRTFNDCVVQEAVRVGVPVVELRQVCDEDADFANPIEPSAQGGGKIAAAIHNVLQHHDFTSQRTTIYV